jgi:peptidoglycan/LPS O-acetylase OafA/YrhL
MLNNARYLPGGFLDGDIFFVLSGFLITALLLQGWQRTGTIRLGAFYARRALRLLEGRGHRRFAFHELVNAFSLRNMVILDRTWSLTVEEQCYVLWPPSVPALLGLRVRRRWILSMVLLGIRVSTGLRLLLGDGPASIKRLLDTRLDACWSAAW